MKNKFICGLLAGALLCLAPAQGFAQTPSGDLPFDRALEIMNQRNEALKAARREKKAREYEKRAAQGLYYPKVIASGRYTRIDEPIAIDLTSIGKALHVPNAALGEFVSEVQDDEFVKGNITASLPLFTGGRITAANKLASAKESAAGEKLRQTRGSLISDMVRRYFGLRLYGEIIDLRQDYLDGVKRHLARARALEKNGIISRAERLHAQVAVAEAQRELKSTQRDREVIRTALANILAMGRDGNLGAVSPLFLVRDLPDLSFFVDASRIHNPLLAQVRAKKKMAGEGLSYEKGFLFPEVFAFGKYELHRDDLTLLEPEWAAGIGVKLPLFEGMSRMNTIKAARETLGQVRLLEEKAVRDIATLTEKKYHAVMKQLEQFDSFSSTIELAKEALRVRTRSFEEGLSTSLDVVDSHLTLSGARIKRLKAVYQFDVALAELLEAVGTSQEFITYTRRYIPEEAF